MSGVNRVTLLGRLGKDPELKYTPSGDAVTSFSVATSETWKDKQTGEKREKTEWHRCVAWRKLAEIISKYVGKGDNIYVEGKLQTREWEKDGQKHYMTEIIVDRLNLLGTPKRQDSGNYPEPPPPTQTQSDMDDDIPF